MDETPTRAAAPSRRDACLIALLALIALGLRAWQLTHTEVAARASLMADGLSEPLFFLLTSSALVCAVRALRGSAWRWYAWTGLLSGLAYLTRPEGALTAGATALVLLASQGVPRWRRSWGRCL